MNGQDFEAQTSKLATTLRRRRFIHAAAARLILRGDHLSRKIFAQDGPVRVAVAIRVVAADELKLGRRPLLGVVQAAESRTETYLGRDK